MDANFKSSPRHGELKGAHRIRKRSRATNNMKFWWNYELPKFGSKVSALKKLINSGPYYICCVCSSYPYRRSVGLFNTYKFCVISDNVPSLVSSFDENFYIWKTCRKKLNKKCIPCQAVFNMLEPCEPPKEFRDILGLERVPVARRPLFKKINIMPKG